MRNLTLVVLITLSLVPLSRAQTIYPYAINTLAGTGSLGDGGLATSALLEFPQSVVVDPSGKIYIGDSANDRIRLVTTDGVINTLDFGYAVDMKLDSTGSLYVADGSSRIYKISSTGSITIFAGSALATAAITDLPSPRNCAAPAASRSTRRVTCMSPTPSTSGFAK